MDVCVYITGFLIWVVIEWVNSINCLNRCWLLLWTCKVTCFVLYFTNVLFFSAQKRGKSINLAPFALLQLLASFTLRFYKLIQLPWFPLTSTSTIRYKWFNLREGWLCGIFNQSIKQNALFHYAITPLNLVDLAACMWQSFSTFHFHISCPLYLLQLSVDQ